ncbi:hypothetical protein GUITHDRAFT_70527 [Guillardia theta CCMP2712]|uniref:Uncharacterized protein n=1 Tax=Guillardia theta (strain CCMP2712) TaxID=905079 RepID=L1JDU7_GUITC|eukprot:XP_005833467.1 hypothetical protein GUITHDRAFT_70527 [Guillardia theta CCMP2712]
MISRVFILSTLLSSASAYSLAPVLQGLKAPSSAPLCHKFSARPGVRRGLTPVRAGDQPIPEGFREFQAREKSLDEWFAKLADSRSSIRQMASIKIAEMHDKEGEEQEKAVIQRLFSYLTLEDVHERRAAVQALGMIGQKVLPPLVDMLLATEDRVVRASCSKAIGAVALKNPELLPEFPQLALDGMKKAILDIPDPVTKIATISSLGQIGGGDVAHGYPGCERVRDSDLSVLLPSPLSSS